MKNEKMLLCVVTIVLGAIFPLIMVAEGLFPGIILFVVRFLSYGLAPIFLALPVRYASRLVTWGIRRSTVRFTACLRHPTSWKGIQRYVVEYGGRSI